MTDDRSAAAAFGLLADETRLDVLREVAIAQSERAHGTGTVELSFSTLYDRVGVDGTSKLSYHLGELEGLFLRKGEDGYALTHAGERIVRLILAENYGEPPAFEGTPVPGTCLLCGESTLEASLEHRFLEVSCRNCERGLAGYEVTPAQVRDRSAAAVVDALQHRMSAHYRQVRGGLCPACGGTLSLAVVDTDDVETDLLRAIDECDDCLRSYAAPLTIRTLAHPEPIAFCWERGIDVTSTAPWELLGYIADGQWSSARTATDPAAYEVVYRLEGDALRLDLDAELTVTAAERVRRKSVGE